jgi:hypothetical protein
MLNEVLTQLDCIVAPRKDKYQLQNNQLAHYASEHKSMFIESHKALISRYLHEDEEVVENAPRVEEAPI